VTGGTNGAPEKNVVQAVHDALRDEMRRDDRVMVLGEDVGARGGVFRATMGFLDEFGAGRVLDTPLDECLIAGVAIGLALDDMRPVAEIQFADFIFPAFNQIVSEAARIRYRSNGDFEVPLVIRTPYGGGVHGALYHSQSIEAFFAHVPGLKVVAPSTPYDVKGMLIQAIDDPDPVIFLEHKKTYRLVKGPVPEERYTVPFGVAEVRHEGGDLTCVSYGLMLHYCVEAAERLEKEGIGVEVIDLRSIYPLDMSTVLESIGKTSKAMVVHEDNKFLGVGAEVAAQIAEESLFELDAPVMRVGGPHVPAMPYSPTLEHWYLPDVDRLEDQMRTLAEY
jgi:2-oxoisovalerate dehydrogenase E1 component beta subunit